MESITTGHMLSFFQRTWLDTFQKLDLFPCEQELALARPLLEGFPGPLAVLASEAVPKASQRVATKNRGNASSKTPYRRPPCADSLGLAPRQ